MENQDNSSVTKKIGWKERILNELKEYIIYVVYLAIFFGVFTWYRRLILAQHGIDYLDYGTSIIEALILGKIILIGEFMRLGNRFGKKPLIIPTLYKTIVFTLFVALFSLIEYAIRGLIGGKGIMGGIADLFHKDINEAIARNIVIFFVFISFFAFKELGQILGEKKIWHLFFRSR